MKRWDLINKYMESMDDYYNKIFKEKDVTKKIEILTKLYEYVREISLEWWEQDENMARNFVYILREIFACEKELPDIFILNVKPKYEVVNYPKNTKNDEEVLNYIVHQTRIFLHAKLTFGTFIADFSNLDLVNECERSSNFVIKVCKQLGLEAKKIKITSGFAPYYHLEGDTGYHYFVIVNLNNNEYLIDCTYNQFFLLKRCLIERLGIMHVRSTAPGIFMIINDQRKKVAEKILKDGWIKLDGIVLKHYLDGFAISHRNGLYYEKNPNSSFDTSYTPSDYENFLKGIDNQINYEGKEVLGFQKKPLENPKLILKKET